MAEQILLIQPRPPGVVQADELLCLGKFKPPAALTPADQLAYRIRIYDQLFPLADVVNFTMLSANEQDTAMQLYMAMYHCEGLYAKSPMDEWQLRRLPDRRRHDYYWAALCDNNPVASHNLLVTGDWDEKFHQTNLLVVSNPKISDPYLRLKITDNNGIRFDYIHNHSSRICNILVMPDAILQDLTKDARQQLATSIPETLFVASHDDGHGILKDANEEGNLRALTAAMFHRMPLPFRQGVVQKTVDWLSLLDQPKSFKPGTGQQEQINFWHGGFSYALQYLFTEGEPETIPFNEKLQSQRCAMIKNAQQYPRILVQRIHAQTGRDEPGQIHNAGRQANAIAFMRRRVAEVSGRAGNLLGGGAILPNRATWSNRSNANIAEPTIRRSSTRIGSPICADGIATVQRRQPSINIFK